MLYKIFMLLAIPAVAIGWIVYWLWDRKMAEIEKNQPKPVSKHLTKTRSEVSEWAQKMATAESPGEQARKRREAMEKEWKERELREKQQQQGQ